MGLTNLNDLFLQEIKDVYDAEKRIVKSLPKLIKAVDAEELQAALEDHLAVTEKQVARLEEVFTLLEVPARGKKCLAMEGLLKEGSELLDEDAEPVVLDAAIISAAQRVEHYEIAAYGTLVAFAHELDFEEVAQLLEQTLEEEKEADEVLSEIASQVNRDANIRVNDPEQALAKGHR